MGRARKQKYRLSYFIQPKDIEMKSKLSVFTLLLITSFGAFADASSCYSISNQDSKNLCLAQAKQDKSYCYSVSDRDRKNYCLAVVGNDKSYCYSISSSDGKNECLARF